MTCRTSASVAVLTLLGFAAENRLAAQPVVPNRPRSNAFQSLFFPGSQAVPNAGYGPGFGPQFMNRGPFGVVPDTMLAGQQGVYGPGTPLPATGTPSGPPVVFNNLGHWYSGNYGHWYPGGVTSGMGVLANGGGPARGGPIMTGGPVPAVRPVLNTGGGVGIGVALPLGGTGHRGGTPHRR